MYVLIIRMCATLLVIVLLMSTACSGPLATFPSTPYPSPAATVPPTVAMPPSPVTLLPTFTPAPTPVPRVLLVDAAQELGPISPLVYGTNYSYGIKYWGIGNELSLYAGNRGLSDYDMAAFNQQWRELGHNDFDFAIGEEL
jgi:hypothetical protein